MTADVTLPADADGDAHEELFYESLDRILSSSCSSTSASDDESAAGDRLRRRCPTSFSVSSSLDVWTSAPASVAERRRVLLLRLGLAGDPSLSRLNSCPPAFSAGDALVDRSAPRPQLQHQRSTHLPASGRPPTGAGPRSSSRGAGGRRRDDDGDSRCLIKNLDDGREFVVEEFREDGTWGELRELRTGRQLTVEEFEMCVGRSPIVQELMRRQSAEEESTSSGDGVGSGGRGGAGAGGGGTRSKKIGGWLRSIRSAAGAMVAGGHSRERRSSDEKDSSSEIGANDGQDGVSHCAHHGLERIKVRQYGKSNKELSGLYLSQRIQAHSGSIWSIKFSLDGRYLASAGEDCVIRVWEILETENKAGFASVKTLEENGSRNSVSNGVTSSPGALSCEEGNTCDQKRQSKISSSRKSVSSETMEVPEEHVSVLSERPICSFSGHLDDVLDLSWSKSQYLLSSSMDKTVRLWHMPCNSCLKIFSHSDYVTCIQFNPVDDRYFISGSLDEKVRIWSIPDRRIVDWTDLHEMITAASFTPDGKGALVGSHKGSCHLYDTFDNKLLHKGQIDLENKKKKSRHKKITGFQFSPDISSRVLITSADSRIRAVDCDKVVQKFKGFRNTSSQISACFSADGKYVICASEDSHVYMWRYDDDSRPGKRKTAVVKQCYEHFHCQDVTVAVPWPSITLGDEFTHSKDGASHFNYNSVIENNGCGLPSSPTHQFDCQSPSLPDFNLNHFTDKISATWPEELMTTSRQSPQYDTGFCNGGRESPSSSAWGLAIVTANRSGEIRTFHNFGYPNSVTSSWLNSEIAESVSHSSSRVFHTF